MLGLMNIGRAGIICQIFDEEAKILVASGFTTRWARTPTAEVYDIDSDSWSLVQKVPSSNLRPIPSLIFIGSHPALMTKVAETAIIHLFHPENGTWSALSHKRIPYPLSIPIAIHSSELGSQCNEA